MWAMQGCHTFHSLYELAKLLHDHSLSFTVIHRHSKDYQRLPALAGVCFAQCQEMPPKRNFHFKCSTQYQHGTQTQMNDGRCFNGFSQSSMALSEGCHFAVARLASHPYGHASAPDDASREGEQGCFHQQNLMMMMMMMETDLQWIKPYRPQQRSESKRCDVIKRL